MSSSLTRRWRTPDGQDQPFRGALVAYSTSSGSIFRRLPAESTAIGVWEPGYSSLYGRHARSKYEGRLVESTQCACATG